MPNDQIQLVRPEIPEYRCRTSIVDWDGVSISETLTLPPCFKIMNSGCSKRTRKQDPVTCNGTRRFGGQWNERKVTIDGTLDAATKELLQSAQEQINAFLNEDHMLLSWNNSYLRLSYLDRQNWTFQSLTGNEVSKVSMPFYCEDPFWYSQATFSATTGIINNTSIDSAFANTSTFEFYPLIKFTSASSGSSGDIITISELESASGNVVRTFTIRIARDMLATESLEINLETGNVSVVDSVAATRTDARAWIAGEFFPFSKSSAFVRSTSTNDGLGWIVDFSWRNRWI